jgi:hypothetical protein
MSTASAPALPGEDYLPVRPDWLARREELMLEPDLPIIDAHHTYGTLMRTITYGTGRAGATCSTSCWPIPAAATTFSPRSLCRRAPCCGPAALRHVGETEFVNGAAAMSASGIYGKTRHCAGIVGHADLTLGGRVEPVLEAHMRAGGDRFRGNRHSTA